nr:hypothetical protein [Tanacetum cinerariifolium]
MPQPSPHFKILETSTEEMMKEWMAKQTETNERIKNQELKSIDGVGNEVLTKKDIKKDENGNGKGGRLEAKSIDLTSL